MGLLFGIALKLVMKAVVMPLFGAPALNPSYQFLAGNARALFGRGLRAAIGFVIVTSLWFWLIHYFNQQWPGVQQAVVFGVIFATILVRTGDVWMLMVAHVAFDLTALAIIYLGLEAAVA